MKFGIYVIHGQEIQNFKFCRSLTNGFRDISISTFHFFAKKGVAAKCQIAVTQPPQGISVKGRPQGIQIWHLFVHLGTFDFLALELTLLDTPNLFDTIMENVALGVNYNIYKIWRGFLFHFHAKPCRTWHTDSFRNPFRLCFVHMYIHINYYTVPMSILHTLYTYLQGVLR